MNLPTRQSGSDRFVARFAWLGDVARWFVNLFKGQCPDCGAAMPIGKLFRINLRSEKPAACSACGALWVPRNGAVMLMAKFFVIGVPIIFISVGVMSLILERIPFFQNPDPVGTNDGLLFRAFPILAFVFYAAAAFFFRRLPLKRVTT
ncbi:hypothetical protein [uncultured Sulfitobacter sp.]|uniref:hypothetical protein n=1 Tax=uncultured Sulfitobacter sp. TaxID=191468 RepID=UPI0026025240|nr:hypothetical protein [uncultured Sulfitobacter sp.]